MSREASGPILSVYVPSGLGLGLALQRIAVAKPGRGTLSVTKGQVFIPTANGRQLAIAVPVFGIK